MLLSEIKSKDISLVHASDLVMCHIQPLIESLPFEVKQSKRHETNNGLTYCHLDTPIYNYFAVEVEGIRNWWTIRKLARGQIPAILFHNVIFVGGVSNPLCVSQQIQKVLNAAIHRRNKDIQKKADTLNTN
jgi:hypothetical protein